MPIFHKKSNFKPSPSRTGRLSEALCPRLIDLNADPNNIRLEISEGKSEIRFVDGMWLQQSVGGSNLRTSELQVDDLLKLKAKMDKLEQENNLLQVKVDILVDMLSENVCKSEEEK